MELRYALTQEEIDVLAHVVVDPVQWVEHCIQHAGASSVAAKIEKYRPQYLAALAAEGAGYKTRAVRQAEEDEATQREVESAAAASAEAEAEKQRAFDAAVRAAVAAALEAKA